MATNWWEIGKPVQDFEPVAQEKKEQNWWEIGKPVEEPPKAEVASVQPVVSQEKPTPGTSFEELFGGPITPETAASYKAVSQPPLPAIYDELKRQAIAEGQTSNVLVGGVARSQEILGNLLQGVGRISDVIPEEAYTTSPALGGIKAGLEAISPKLETAAGALKGEAEKVKYGYGTELKELTDNPLNIVPFVLERFAVSIPDMGAALTAAPAYIVSLTNQSLNDRLKNDGRTYEQATIGDVIAAGSSAMLQAKLEKFATSRLGQAETVLGQTALQGGTEALEEVGQYIAETAGTKAGFDPTTAGLVGLEAGLAGSGIGLVAGGVQDLVQRRIEARIRGNEELGSQIENDMLDEIRKQAFEKAQTIAAPEPNQIPLDEGQTEATPVQYGDAYAQKIYDTIGRYIPINAEFKVEEKTIDGLPQFVVTDKDGVQYGKGLDSRNKADSLALSLNNTTKSRAEIINQLAPLQSSLTESLKGFGLGDIGLSLNNRVFTRRGEALTSEGLFDPVVRRVFLAVDAIDPQGNLDTNQRREALGGVLRHEVVHALRYLDLWKRSEWKNLEKTASTLKKPGTDKTYLQVAQEAYSDQNKVIQVEESVADLIRDVSRNRSKVAGKPRNLSERAINFFDKAKNALTGAGFQTYEDVINRLETGEIGARQRGRIRTFRATEEQQAAQGQLPERVQRLFTNPEERNRFRAEAVQSVQPKTPETPLPAINALRLNAVRESRSTIDPVPPKITVDKQEVPTRDSEGRLIYSGYEGPEVFGIQTRPTQEGISNFWNWFGKSKEVDKDKRPLVYYHGTAADVTEFKPKQAGSVFITRSPQFAQTFSDLSSEYMISNFPDFMNDQEVLNILTESMRSPTTPSFYDKLEKVQKRASDFVGSNQPFSGELIQDIKKLFRGSGKSSYMAARIQSRLPSNANIVPVYVKAENPFDYENPEHIKKVLKKIDETSVIELDSGQIEGLKKGDWTAVESPVILNAIKNLGFDSMYVEEMDEKNLAVFNPNQIKSAVGNNGDFSPITPSIRESRVAKPRQILFEVAPDPNNQPLTEAWRRLDPSVRLTVSERVAKNIVPMVLDASGARGTVVSQVGSYGEDTNPSFALMLESGDPLDVAKSIGFALSQDSMMVVAPNKFKGGDVVQSVTVRLGEKSPQEVASIYNSLREIEVDGSKPVGGQTFANGSMTILNYSDVPTDTLADLIDKKLNGEYNVLVRDVYSAFPEKKDYDYASPENDGSGSRADLRQRLRDIRAEATDSVQRELQGLATQGGAAAPAEAIVPAAREARRRGTPIGPTQPGPENDTDNTSAAEALNNGQPVDRIGAPSGPTISDTMPDGTVDVSRSRIAPLTRRLIAQMIQSAPDKLRSGFGLDDLAKRIENYYDTYASRLGVANGIIRDAFKRIDLGGRTAALDTFEQFIRARENNRTEEAQAILDAATDSERQLIDAWNQIAIQTGEINTSLRTPDGKPMRVWDAKRGEWRPIRSVRNFFPRTFRREVMEVMQNPDLDPVLWQSLLDSLVAAGRAETTQDAEKYLLREWFSDEVTQDYFAGVEKARNEPLPEIFYDYSWDAATRYIRKWSRRTAQIENFGQTLGTFQKEWFDANITKVRDQETQNYLNAIKERVYEIEQFNALTNMANWFNSLATGLMLGNWASASLNLLGGTITNVQEFGIKEIGKSYIDLVRYWKNVQEEGTTLGILNKDFLNILNDHVEMDADKYFSREQKISQGLAKFTNVMLNVGLFNSAENVVRSSALLAAHSRLNKFLRDVNEGRETKQVQAFREWVKRENLDIDALILENGAGKETERFMRRAVNVPQGSYSIDMTPVFIDTGAGRFLLKYQKFGTQINRFFYNHFLKPFHDKPNQKNFMRLAGFLGTAIIGGWAIIAIREALGYGDPGPDDEEIKKAFENEDTARAWGLIFSRAWQNIMAAGSLGFFANYAQFAMDWQDQQRVKNPFSPPGLASVDAVIDVFNRLRDQGKLTARDLDEIAETTVSFYRAGKRTTLAAMDAMGSDAREVRRFAAQKELREVREYGRRYSEAMEIEFKRRTAPGAPIRTPMTPINKAITDALHVGDAARARLLIREAKSQVPFSERERVMASIRAAVRNRQPIQIGDSAPSQQERAEFMRWARNNLPEEKYQMIRSADRRYSRAAARAGVGFGD